MNTTRSLGRAICTILAALASVWGQEETGPSTKFLDAGASRTEQRQWALLIGVNVYREAGNLKYANNDMKALRDCLIEAGFARERVVCLHDRAEEPESRPTGANIRRELDRLLGRFDPKSGKLLVPGVAAEGDLVVIAFSGHGVVLEGKSYFCPEDTQIAQHDTLISVDDLYAHLNAVPARQKLLVVDACRNDPTRRKGTRGFEGTKQLARSLEQPPLGILVLSSCTMGQYSFEDDQLKHGVFTYYLVEGLKGRADDDGDGRVTLLDLYRYASRQTEQRVARVFSDQQRPMLKGEVSGDFEIGSRSLQLLKLLQQGRNLIDQFRYDEAIAVLGTALKLAPRSVDARIERARAWLQISNAEGVLSDSEEALRIQPEAVEALIMRSRGYRMVSRFDLSTASCEEALRIDPKSTEALIERGLLARQRGLPELALADLTNAFQRDPTNLRAAANRARVLEAMGDKTGAIAAARTARALLPSTLTTPSEYYYRGVLTFLIDPADDAKAIADLDMAIRLNPRGADAYAFRGAIHYQRGRFVEAREDCKVWVDLQPRLTGAHSDLGFVLLGLNDATGALAEFDRALQLYADLPSALRGRSTALLRTYNSERALADANRLVELRPKDASSYVTRGNVFRVRLDDDRALADYNRALGIDPKSVFAYQGRGNVYLHLGNVDRAGTELDRALEIEPDRAALYVTRGHILLKKKDLGRARADAEQALKLKPDLADALNLVGNIELARSRPDLALDAYTRALELSPLNAAYHNNQALALDRSGDLKKALEAFDRSIQLDPNYALAYANRGKSSLRHGLRGWEDDFKKARRLGLEDPIFSAVERRGLVFVRNRTKAPIAYSYRWRLPDGTFTDWKTDEVVPDKSRYVWHRAGTSVQIRFDDIPDNNRSDETTIDLKPSQIDMNIDPKTKYEPLYEFRLESGRLVLKPPSPSISTARPESRP